MARRDTDPRGSDTIAWPAAGLLLLLLAKSYANTAVRRHPTAPPPPEASEPEPHC